MERLLKDCKLLVTLSSSLSSSSQVKVALQNLEWVTNFGLDANSLKSHPGESAFSIKTLDAFGGRFPTMWELKATNSSIVANVSQDQWGDSGLTLHVAAVLRMSVAQMFMMFLFNILIHLSGFWIFWCLSRSQHLSSMSARCRHTDPQTLPVSTSEIE